jgi:hypothetical protein
MEDTSELVKEYLKIINSMKTEIFLLKGKLKQAESRKSLAEMSLVLYGKDENAKNSSGDSISYRDILASKDAEISKLKQELGYEREAYGKLRSDHNKLLDLIHELVESLERSRPFNKANVFLLEKLTEITNKVTEDSKDLPAHSPRQSLLTSSTESQPLHRIVKRLKILEDENSKLKSALESSEASREQLVVEYKSVLSDRKRSNLSKPKLRELDTQLVAREDEQNDANRFLFPLNEVSEEHEEDMNFMRVNQVMNNIAQQMMNTVTELRNKKSPRGFTNYLKIPG